MEYAKISQENSIDRKEKDQSVKYKEKEIKGLGKAFAELSADQESKSAELSAVNEYFDRLKRRCIAKPETYEERKKRRSAELQGLKEALSILEGEAALVQRRKGGRHHIRGAGRNM